MEQTNFSGVDCRESIARLYEFLDNELCSADQAAIKRHIEHCSPCLEAFEFEAELKSMIRSRLRKEGVPLELKEKIRKALASE
ncbi:MAG: mycothiol system anti-sigma-R factor [Acidimicrobiaceae bacterium]|nr:mycothiol system anti-sigma-R factor [Acidimicrobiaceae bacterium]